MRLLAFVIILMTINNQLFCQSFDGYYETIDENGSILERLILNGERFELYNFKNGVLNIGIGSYILSNDSLIFNYESREPFRIYRIRYNAYGRSRRRLSIMCKIDTSSYTDRIITYEFIMHDKSDREFNITKGFSTSNSDTIELKDITFITKGIIKSIEPIEDCSKHEIIFEFDNTSTKYIDAMVISYSITNSDNKTLVLRDVNNKTLIYFRNEENEKGFRDFINLKNEIEYEY